MSLKRRNVIAFVLILLASVCWSLGRQMDTGFFEGNMSETTTPGHVGETSQSTIHPTTTISTAPEWETMVSSFDVTEADFFDEKDTAQIQNRQSGFVFYVLSIIAGFIAVFVISQKNAILGPDGICLALALLATVHHITLYTEYILWNYTVAALNVFSRVVGFLVCLLSVREFYGWIRAKFTLSWCVTKRIADHRKLPQASLLIYVLWIILSLVGVLYFAAANAHNEGTLLGIVGYLSAAAFGFRGLWKYGADLDHFKRQLNNYQHGKPITVGDGAFAQTEAQLLDVQAQHEEAVRTAVTSERFKVELISNVSHDLRTPLTAILGYSELLQNETLSPGGQEQLRRLYQKAGYMNDLVESLFELTKVSSGVVESKKEQIDLVRLMEQTIGLFDDQLVSAGLVVKRSYCADTIPAITDGARMHQVFANLLGNAIKYALAGTRIYLEVRETNSRYLIRMMNTASYEMDFKPDEIIQRFARGDKARATKGSGLGLAIAQTYTESVGGSFRVSVDGDQFSAIVELPKS